MGYGKYDMDEDSSALIAEEKEREREWKRYQKILENFQKRMEKERKKLKGGTEEFCNMFIETIKGLGGKVFNPWTEGEIHRTAEWKHIFHFEMPNGGKYYFQVYETLVNSKSK